MFSRILIFVLLISIFAVSPKATAKELGIVAVVNDEIISNFNLYDRMNVILASSGLKDTKETRKRILPQVLQLLINEALQRQEAEKNNVALSEAELSRAIAGMEKQNNVAPGELDKFLSKQRVPKGAFLQQLRAQLTWQKLLARKVRPNLTITDSEVAEAKVRLKGKTGAREVNIAEIVLPFGKGPNAVEDMRKNAEQLLANFKEGADFSLLAQQFSQSTTASKGGTIGWIPEADLGAELRLALSNLKKGEVTEPIRYRESYYILKLVDTRKTAKGGTPDENFIREYLLRQKLELEARKYLKQLRRNAFIEKRIG